MKAVFDTNILIDFLSGYAPAQQVLQACGEKIISRITWMEVLVGVRDATDESAVRTFLATFRIAEISAPISEAAVQLRRTATPRLKLPDAIIYATFRAERCSLITRNTRDFPDTLSDVSAPYSR